MYYRIYLKHSFVLFISIVLSSSTVFFGMAMKAEISPIFIAQLVHAQGIEICGDGLDNNGNGAVDEEPCQIPPPAPLPTSPTSPPPTSNEICGDGLDNNGNGAVDEEPCEILSF